jgi:glutathione S-transferase
MKLFGAMAIRSFNTMKIRAALAEAGAAYDYVPVDIPKGENKTPAFLAMNPHGKVPVLVDGNFTLAESDAILWYVAEEYPMARLLPADARGRARVLQWCAFASTGLYAGYLQARMPEVAEKGRAAIDRALGVLDLVLADREYLAGPFSIADLSGAAIIQTLKDKLPDDPAAKYDRIRPWHERITSRPAWARALAT